MRWCYFLALFFLFQLLLFAPVFALGPLDAFLTGDESGGDGATLPGASMNFSHYSDFVGASAQAAGVVEGSYLIEFQRAPLVESFSEGESRIESLEKDYAATNPISRRGKSLERQIERAVSEQHEDVGNAYERLQTEHEQALRDLSGRVTSSAPDLGVFSFTLPVVTWFTRMTGYVFIGEGEGMLIPDEEYYATFNGVAVSGLSTDDVAAINRSRYVKNVYPNSVRRALLDASVPATGADRVWELDADGAACSESGKPCVTGKGVRVGVIDTGIDYKHPDLGDGCFALDGPSCASEESEVRERESFDVWVTGKRFLVSLVSIDTTSARFRVVLPTRKTVVTDRLVVGGAYSLGPSALLRLIDIHAPAVAGEVSSAIVQIEDSACSRAPVLSPVPPSPPKTPSCTDSDGGKEPNVKGTITCGSEVYTDSCYSSMVVTEYYYDEEIDSWNMDRMSCAPGERCGDGACTSAANGAGFTGSVIASGEQRVTSNSPRTYLPVSSSGNNARSAAFERTYGTGWNIEFDAFSERPISVRGSNIPAAILGADRVSGENVAALGKAFLEQNVDFFGVDPASLAVLSTSGGVASQGITQVVYQQRYEGIPVYNSFVVMSFKNNALISYYANYFDVKGVTVSPRISPLGAIDAATRDTGVSGFVAKPELVIYPRISDSGVEYSLGYIIDQPLTREPIRKYRVIVDAQSGAILESVDRLVYEVSGTVSGMIFPEHAQQTTEEQRFAHQRVSIGAQEVVSDTQGSYTANLAAGPHDVKGTLEGPLARVAKGWDREFIYQNLILDSSRENLYLTAVPEGNPRVKRINVHGGPIEQLLGASVVEAVDASEGMLYWSEDNFRVLKRGDLDGKNGVQILTFPGGLDSVAFDFTKNKIYWDEWDAKQKKMVMKRADLDGTNPEDLSAFELPSIVEFLVDGDAGVLYYLNPLGEIHRIGVDGSGDEKLIEGVVVGSEFALDTANDYLYWVGEPKTGSRGTTLRRSTLEGKDTTTLVRSLRSIKSVAIDISGRKLYWSQGTHLFQVDFEGKNMQAIRETEANPLIVHQSSVTAPGTHSWNWAEEDTSERDEASNLFYHTNKISDFFKSQGVSEVDTQFSAYYNLPGTCNALYYDDSINFFRKGDGCENTALLSDVIYHEYTHGMVDSVITIPFPYWGQTGNLNEAWADYFAVSENGNSCLAEGFYEDKPSGCLRDCKNTNRWPENYNSEPHTGSPIICGALWDLREVLGKQATDRLVIDAITLQPSTYAMFLENVLIADDTNGNLNDGTPHRDAICAAFSTKHGVNSSYCHSAGTPKRRTPRDSFSQCKIAGGYDFVNHDSDPMDDNGHGTHVAGIIAARPRASAGVPEGAIAHWQFNETVWAAVQGEVEDSVSNHEGTAYHGARPNVGGIGGSAAAFDGEHSFIAIEKVPALGNTFTVSGWFNAASKAGKPGREMTGSWLSSRNSFVLGPNGDGSVSFYVFLNGQWIEARSDSARGGFTVGEWEHWAGSYDGSAVRLYKNGVEVATTPASGMINAADRFCIGADCNTGAVWRADSCYSPTVVQEYYEDDLGGYTYEYLTCPTNQICSDGTCVPGSATAALRVYTVASGGGAVEADTVLTLEVKNEHYTSQGSEHYFTDIPVGRYNISAHASGYGEGIRRPVIVANRNNNKVTVVLKQTLPGITGFATAPLCSDTDRGRDYYNKGTITCGSEQYTDSCYSSSVVKEFYYDAEVETWNSEYLGCQTGMICIEGACVREKGEETSDTCYDDDGGKIAGTKGTISCDMWNRYYEGLADEIMVYDRALSGQMIQELYLAQLSSLRGETPRAANGKYGVAPDATLYAFKVLDADGYGTVRDILAAFDRALDPNGDGNLNDRLDIISVSLGGDGTPDDVLSLAVDRLVGAGVVAVVAAGNCGPGGSPFECSKLGDYNTIGSPGTSRKAITVGAATNARALASFSSRGPIDWDEGTLFKPDVLAPGVGITSTVPGGGYRSVSGTSMATPHVSGVVALMKQAHPDWSPDDIKAALRSSAGDISLSWHRQGYGFVQASDAVFRNKDTVRVQVPSRGTGIARVELDLQRPEQASSLVLEYGEGLRPETWTAIPLASGDLRGNKISVDVSTFELKEGSHYAFRVRSAINEERFLLLADNLDTRALPKSHVYAARGLLPVSIGVHSAAEGRADIKGYALEYRAAGSEMWSIEHMLSCRPVKGMQYAHAPRELCENLGSREQRFYLNTSFITTVGFYEFRARLTHQDREIVEGTTMIWLDPEVHAGFPQPLPFGEKGSVYAGDFVPIVRDLVEDSKPEIIMHRGRFGSDPYSTILVYRNDGTLAWTSDVGRDITLGSVGASAYASPVLGDVAGDARDEILVPITPGAFDRQTNLIVPLVTQLYALNAVGYSVDGWPIEIPTSLSSRMVVADLDRDLENEIIVQTNLAPYPGDESLSIIRGTKIVKQWPIPRSYYEGMYSPAVGNFDADDDLEIVIVIAPRQDGYENATVFVYNADGTLVPGWPVILPITISNDYVPVVGDVDQDGRDDIVVGGVIYLGKDEKGFALLDGLLYVIHGNGTVHSKYPQSLGFVKYENYHAVAHFPKGSSALVDIDFKPGMEIATLTAGSFHDGFLVDLRHANGSAVAGWPQKVPYFAPLGAYGPTITDASGDGKLDVLVASGNAFVKVKYREDGKEHTIRDGGIFAWHANGTLIAGFPKSTQYFSVASPVVADLDGNGRASLIGTSFYDQDVVQNVSLNRGTLYVWDLEGPAAPEEEAWTMYRRDSVKSACAGCYPVADFEIETFQDEDAGLEQRGTALLSKKYPIAILYNESMRPEELEAQGDLLMRSLLFTPSKVKVLSEKIPLLNRRAQIVFREVDLKKPLVLYNNQPCTQQICTSIIYNESAGVLIVNVTNFSTFELTEAPVCGDRVCQAAFGETCSACVADCGICPAGPQPPAPGQDGGGGGGGGGGGTPVQSGGGDFAPCKPQWQCSFGTCVEGNQSKACVDARACNTTAQKPEPETRVCNTTALGNKSILPVSPTTPPKSGEENGTESLPAWIWVILFVLIAFALKKRRAQMQAKISELRRH